MAAGQSMTITINAENKAAPVIDDVKKQFKDLAEGIGDSMESANEETEKSGSKLGGVLKSVLGGITGLFGGIAGVVGGIFSGVVKLAGSIFSGLIDVVKGVVGGIISAFKLLPDAVGLIFNKVTAIAIGAFGFVVVKLGEAAAKSEAMGTALERLAKRTGSSSAEIIAAIKRGSGETISKLDAMRVANEALIAKLDLTPEKFERLAAVADLLADAVGGDTAEAFASLIQAIKGGNDKLLEGVGINIEAEAVFADYAKTLKKSVTDLTEAEKSQALLNAVLIEGDRLMKEAEGSADLLGDAYDRINVLLADGFTEAADAVRGGLLTVSTALEPILISTKGWIEANRELITSKVGEFAEKLADAISRFANRLPEIIDLVGNVLAKAFEIAGKAGEIAWNVITNVIGGAMREFDIFRDALLGLLEGKDFSIEGSVLLQTFRVIKTQAKLAALEIAAAFNKQFGEMSLGIATKVTEIGLQLNKLQDNFSKVERFGKVYEQVVTLGYAEGTIGQAMDQRYVEQAELQMERNQIELGRPKSSDDIGDRIKESIGAAKLEADTELLRLGLVAKEAQGAGDRVRAAASKSVSDLTSQVALFFSTDEERAAAELEATENANASAVGAMDSAVKVAQAVIAEQKRARAEYEKARAAFDEMLRQRGLGSDYGGVQAVSAGG